METAHRDEEGSATQAEHLPVLLDEVLAAMCPHAGGCYVDATYGRGGHAAAIAEAMGPQGRLWLMDQDPDAIAHAQVHFAGDDRIRIQAGNFATLAAVLAEAGEQADAVLLDLGVSSPQLDQAERGFSYRQDGPLDMRMNPQAGVSAAEWLATVEEHTLRRVLKQYGQERYARRIARAIVEQRVAQPIVRTGQLAELTARAMPRHEQGKPPARRVFQALRMVVNDELGVLQQALQQASEAIKPGGRLLVIGFHSLEIQAVRRFLRDQQPDIPAWAQAYGPMDDAMRPGWKRVAGSLRAGADELARNRRARSAVLQVLERCS